MSYLIGGGLIYIEASRAADQPAAGVVHQSRRTRLLRDDGHPDRARPGVHGGRRARTRDDKKLAIVNESMAAKFWPGQDPIGKRFRVFNPTDPLLEVVGVARDSKYVVVFEAPRPYIYLPLVRDLSMRTLHVRASGDPAALGPRLEREIRGDGARHADRGSADDGPVASGIFGYLIFRVGALQAGGMGLLGLILAIVGVYGVVSFGASLRTREIGIRVALGAQPRDVLRLILGQGLALVGDRPAGRAGVSAGMSRVLARFLPLVDAADWMTFAGVAIGLAAITLLACYVPARRATNVPVMTALRYE